MHATMSAFTSGFGSDVVAPKVATKLFPPRPRETDIERTELVSLLNRDPGRRITTIIAPAGSGKSTLVAQWLARTGGRTAWVTLGAGDGQPRPFFTMIVASLHELDPDLVPISSMLIADQSPFQPNEFVIRLSEDLSEASGQLTLVIDDYHVVADATHRAMNLLNEYAPALRIVLVGRSIPTTRTSGRRLKTETRPLQLPDLAFAPSESAEFFRQRLGLDLTTSEVEAIHLRAEGWPMGLHLVGLAVRHAPRERIRAVIANFRSSLSGGVGDLWDLVIQDLPADLRSFLLRTSILERFSPQLCDAVVGIADSERHIHDAIVDGLFVAPLNEHNTWYRYHQVFADALRARLSLVATRAEIVELHLRAARWFGDHGFFDDAVRHAVAGRDWKGAITLLTQECSLLFNRDHVATLRDRLDGQPDQIFTQSPQLAFWFAWSLGRVGEWDAATKYFQMAEHAWTETFDPAGRGALLLWHSLFTGDNGDAIATSKEALDVLPEDRFAERIYALSIQGIACLRRGEPARAELAFADLRSLSVTSGLTWFVLHAMAHSAGALIQRGQLDDAASLCRAVVDAAGPRPVEMRVQAALYRLGIVHYEWGRLDEALAHLQRAEDLAEVIGTLPWRDRICVALARIAWARGKPDEAFSHLDRALDYAARVGKYQPIRDVMAWQARFWLAAKDVDRARRWSEQVAFDMDQAVDYVRQVEHLTYVRFLIRDGSPQLALKALEPVIKLAQAAGRDGELIEMWLLEALALEAVGRESDAQLELQRALNLGQTAGYKRVFVDEGDALATLMHRTASENDHIGQLYSGLYEG